jgi:hypothetical protein
MAAECQKGGESVARKRREEKIDRNRPARIADHWAPEEQSREKETGVLELMPKGRFERQIENRREVPQDYSTTTGKPADGRRQPRQRVGSYSNED